MTLERSKPDTALVDRVRPNDDGVRLLMLQRRLAVFASETTLAIMPLIVAMSVLIYVFRNQASHLVLGVWSAAVVLEIVLFWAILRRLDVASASFEELQRQWRLFIGLQWFGSVIWAAVFPYLALFASGLEIPLLAMIGTGILSGVLMVHRTAPSASIFHLIVVAAALILSVFMVGSAPAWPAVLIICSFAVALNGALRGLERDFVASAEAEVERRESSSTIHMLLNDYEEQSSDWLWTVGPQGNLRDVSERLAQALGQSREALEGAHFLDRFNAGEERDSLAVRLMERSPFRDLLVRLRVDGELRYWRLSARPREDGRMSGVARDVTAERLIEERVAFMAHYDNLTGLANRYLFNERLRAFTGEHRSKGSNIALFYLDLDDFKAVNDTRGHLVGDRLLREVGTRLEQEIRSEDLVARLGGDEFAVLIETRAGDGLLIERAHRFLSVVRAPYEIDGNTYRISTSVGVARCVDGDCDAEELMRRADLALYAAKEKGRDNLALFEPGLDKAARDRREIESDLREALARGQMRMHYQSIVELDSGQTTGYEALLRWYHPQRGMIAPTDFLQVAEDTGMILQLGEWVIRQSLADAVSLPGNFRIAINLSPTQVSNPNLVATVAQALHATNIDPERVELEITEHVLMDQGETGHVTLLRLRELGVRVALDDFGTGYSSLGYLRRFPFDRIKIDRTFVTDIASDIGSQAIVSTVTRLADALGMDTTAEGIENHAQLDLLRKLGVQEAQGFLISRPVPPEEIGSSSGTANSGGVPDPALGEEFLKYRKKRQTRLSSRHGGDTA